MKVPIAHIDARTLLLPPLVFLLYSYLLSLDKDTLDIPHPDGWQDADDTEGIGDADALDAPEDHGDPGDVVDTAPDTVAPGECHRRILISTPGDSDLADYQVPILIPRSPSMQADFGDLRFVPEEGGAFLSHFLKPAPDGGSVTAWVKVPSIPSGADTVVVVYYGNAALTDTSDPWAVFDFYDPFEEGELSSWIELPDVDAWGLTSTHARSGMSSINVGDVYNVSGTSNYLIADIPATADLAVDSWWIVSAVPVDIAIILIPSWLSAPSRPAGSRTPP